MDKRIREVKGAATRERAEHRVCLAQYKAASFDDNAGIFEGYLAVFNNQDLNGDIIERGAFTKTLGHLRETKARNNSPYLFPILWQHNDREPIGGFIDAHEDDQGLFVRGQYDLDTELGARAYSGAKKGYLTGLSIGYDTVKSMFDPAKIRHLLELRLWEGSPVTFPANPQAGIRDVKAATGKTDWPLADRDVAWDGGAAHSAILEWAGGADNFDVSKMKSVHFYTDGDGSKVGDYKLLFCDVIGGEVKAVPKAIFACTGSHGIQSTTGISSSDMDGIKSKIATYYGKMAKQFDDDSIQVPWSAKAMSQDLRRELKDLTGLGALTGCAQSLDNISDGSQGLIECLANACGMSLNGGNAHDPEPAVAALLAGIDGLDTVVKAVVMAWQELSQQTDALLDILGLPDYDQDYGYAVPMYMSQLRSAFELKVGRQLSQTNRDRLQAVADGLDKHASEVKSILKENDNPLKDESDTRADYGDIVASGKPNQGKQRGTGQEPGSSTHTTPTTTQPEPGGDDTTLAELQAQLLKQQILLQQYRLKQ